MNLISGLASVLLLVPAGLTAAHEHGHDHGSKPAAPASAPPAAAGCPTAAEARAIGELYAKRPAPVTFAAAPQLKLPESTIAAGMPASLGAGTDGSQFQTVWNSLTTWNQATFLITKGGNVFEVTSRVAKGEPSKKSRFFNLDHSATVSGHLRPDLIKAIHVMELPSSEGMARGVMFYDEKGDHVFGVFLPDADKEPSPQALAQFRATWELIRSLPARCPRPSA